jgi:hypothetical protein
VQQILLAPIAAVQTGWTALGHALVGVFTSVADTVSGVFSTVRDVGGDGIPLDEFLSRPVTDWLQP